MDIFHMNAVNGVEIGLLIGLIGGGFTGVLIHFNFLWGLVVMYFTAGAVGIVVLMGFAKTLTEIQAQTTRTTELMEFLTNKLEEQ